MSGQRKGSRQAVRMVGAGGYESAPLPLRRTKYTPPLALTRRLARRGHPRQRPDWLLRPRLLASAVCPRPLLGPPCAPCSQRRFRRESRRWRRTSCETPCGEDEAPGIRFYHAANLADPRMLQRHCGSTRRRRNDRGAGVPCRWAGQALLASASPCPAYVQRLVFVGREDGKLLALRQLIHDGFTPPALVFVQVGAAESENKGDLMCVWSDSCSISLSFVNLRLSLSQSKERAIELHKALALECRCEQEARAPQIGIGILRTSLNFIGLCCTCPSPLVQQLWWPVQRRHDSRRPDASAGTARTSHGVRLSPTTLTSPCICSERQRSPPFAAATCGFSSRRTCSPAAWTFRRVCKSSCSCGIFAEAHCAATSLASSSNPYDNILGAHRCRACASL